MGYTLPAVAVTDLRKELANRIDFLSNFAGSVTGTTETTIYKNTIDLTDVDTLTVTGFGFEDGTEGDAYFKAGGTQRATWDITYSGTMHRDCLFYSTMDVSSNTGNTAVEITAKNDNVAGTTYVAHVCIVRKVA